MNSVKNLNHAVNEFIFRRSYSAAAALLHAVRSAITATAKLFVEVHINANAK